MPLLRRDVNRDGRDGGGGSGGGDVGSAGSNGSSSSGCCSQYASNAATPKSQANTNGPGSTGLDSSQWPWEPPRSPEAAQSPRELVPATCFPPRDPPPHLSSISEHAHPGNWGEEAYGITDLVESFKALATPVRATGAAARRTRLSCELTLEATWPQEGASYAQQAEATWPAEGASYAPAHDDSRVVSRRASFCGAVESRRGDMVRWSGVLPARCLNPSPPGGFSPKVFIGGLPWDISEDALLYALKEFQPVRVEWPGRDAAPRGFAYVTLESERRVRALLHASRHEQGKWIYRVRSRNLRTKDAEVIPWAVVDSNWVCPEGNTGAASAGGAGSVRLEPSRTVFVGALHGILSASALATIMNDLFSGVVYAGIDTDKNKYPIGSGRVTFSNVHSYLRAVAAAFVEISTDKFTKKIQVDPYLEDSMCSVCNLQQGPYFCREPVCFRYFCRQCWSWKHKNQNHKKLMRNSKSATYGSSIVSSGGASGGAQRPAPDQPPLCNGDHAQPSVSRSRCTSMGVPSEEPLALEWLVHS